MLTFNCPLCGETDQHHGCPSGGWPTVDGKRVDCPLLVAERQRRKEHLVYSATSRGRDLDIITYLESGTRPVMQTILCQSSEQSREIARVLTEAKGVE